MKAILIAPDKQSIELININDVTDIAKLISFDTITSDEIGTAGDRLYFDEECFLRGSSGRFQIDKLIPVSGRGVIVSSTDGGVTLSDVIASIDDIRGRIKYL